MDRRRFLALSGSLAGLAAFGLVPGESTATPSLGAYPFTLGVASGDPLPHGVVLWTRLAPDPLHGGGMPHRVVPVGWRLATDPGMRHVVRSGIALARPQLAHAVHVEVGGLRPGRDYFYRFHVRDDESPVGRTRTAPTHADELTLAVATCQKWDDGFYSAYRRMAEEDLDLVVHLGDYIYEYGIGATGGVRGVPLPDTFAPETETLERYRLQHALYRTDADLQRAHARFPWVVTWDDHEVENDYTDAISENNDPPEAFLQRRAVAYQAFYEHLPLRRESLPSGPDLRLYRRLQLGDLVELSVLDTRQYRSDHPCGDGEHPRCPESFDPEQTMMGDRQERWLLRGLDHSRARWNVIAQQVLMAELLHRVGPAGPEFWQDAWDGYPAARHRLLDHLASRSVPNAIVLTGDWHSTFVSDLKPDFRDGASPVVASEFVTPSISSNGDTTPYGPYYGPMIPLNPHIRFFEGDRRGYLRCHVDRERWRTDIRYVGSVGVPDSSITTFASFVVESGVPGVQPA
jgi:alkaline phosphatase D